MEPFLGSGVLFFRLSPPRALLGDLNRELINAFRQVRLDPASVHRAIKAYPTGKRAYYRVRSQDPALLSFTQRAARFIYLNRYCFNGIYRTNMEGVYNVPFGGSRTGQLPSAALLVACSSALEKAVLRAADFEVLLGQVRQGDFVYMDPPYSVANTRTFAEYHPSGFGPRDVKRLRQSMLRLDRQGIPFVLSYADSEESRMLARGFSSQRIATRRNVSGFIGSRRTSYELVISNAPPK